MKKKKNRCHVAYVMFKCYDRKVKQMMGKLIITEQGS